MRKLCMKWKSRTLGVGVIGALLCAMHIFTLDVSAVNAQDYGPKFTDSQVIDLPENSLITCAVSDGYSGSFNYKDMNGVGGSITLDRPPVWGTINGHTFPIVQPMRVLIMQGGNLIRASLSDLNGKVAKTLRATRREAYSWHPQYGTIHYTSIWFVEAELSNKKGGGGGNKNGGNGNTTKPVQFEGFIQYIASIANALEVEVGKEGNFVKLTVDGQTKITINGQSAGLGDLNVGDISKGKYDSANNHALQFMIER